MTSLITNRVKLYIYSSIAILIILLAVGAWFFSSIPKTLNSLRALGNHQIQIDYASTATSVSGTNRLQVAELTQTEVFTIRDSGTVFGINRRDVVINATAPVHYVYGVDLTNPREWEFKVVNEGHLTVVAPGLIANRPALDVSNLLFSYEQNSLFRDEYAVRDILVKKITGHLAGRAIENIPLAREAARREVEQFVRRWMRIQYGLGDSIWIDVLFRDEMTGPEQPLL